MSTVPTSYGALGRQELSSSHCPLNNETESHRGAATSSPGRTSVRLGPELRFSPLSWELVGGEGQATRAGVSWEGQHHGPDSGSGDTEWWDDKLHTRGSSRTWDSLPPSKRKKAPLVSGILPPAGPERAEAGVSGQRCLGTSEGACSHTSPGLPPTAMASLSSASLWSKLGHSHVGVVASAPP